MLPSVAGSTIAGADLTNTTLLSTKSSGLLGVPVALPPAYALINGQIVGPGVQIPFGDLSGADLSGFDLSGADLSDVVLTGADLTGANLTGAFLVGAQVSGAIFDGATLAGVVGLPTTMGSAFYDAGTDFGVTGFDPVAAGWSVTPSGPPVPLAGP